MALKTEQILLLNCLMYMKPGPGRPFTSPEEYEGRNIGEWLNSIDLTRLYDPSDSNPLTTAADWINIIRTVRNDPVLPQMVIAAAHEDTGSQGGGGRSAVFLHEEEKQAVIVFKGTENSKEWMDNCLSCNTSDTPYQKNALAWYREIYPAMQLEQYDVTLSGHSKGGNKAMYIAILDEREVRCESFDGEGFSDKFMTRYRELIARRQRRITNRSINYDFVNFMLNSIGKNIWYHGFGYGSGKLLENHCPETFLFFAKDGSVSMEIDPRGQAEEIAALNSFLNNYLRSMSETERHAASLFVCEIINLLYVLFDDRNAEIVQDIISICLEYPDQVSYLASYLITYVRRNDDFARNVKNLLIMFDLNRFSDTVDQIDEMLRIGIQIGFVCLSVEQLLAVIDFADSHFTSWTAERARKFLQKKGIALSQRQTLGLLVILDQISVNLKTMELHDNGDDIAVRSFRPRASKRQTRQDKEMQKAVQELRKSAENLSEEAAEIRHALKELLPEYSVSMSLLKALARSAAKLEKEKEKNLELAEKLEKMSSQE
ncbi:MAG: DUF2974 domain-containing protein [Solobacterium sp.]|nr:DUF2974 domain-containing protein [Solobacterium sp.]